MFFKCRVCANSPFNNLFGYTDPKETAGKEEDYDSGDASSHYSEASDVFSERTPGEVVEKVGSWMEILHERVQIWDESNTRDILSQVAKFVHKEDDPVLGESEFCCYWHGEKNKSGEPVVWTKRTGDAGNTVEVQAFVSRILVYMFADDASYAEIQSFQKPDAPFKMICGNRLCVKLTHIPIDVVPEDEEGGN